MILRLLLSLLFGLLACRPAMAQELTPRAYWPAPTGTQLLTLGVSHVSGDMIPDPSLPLPGLIPVSLPATSATFAPWTCLAGHPT